MHHGQIDYRCTLYFCLVYMYMNFMLTSQICKRYSNLNSSKTLQKCLKYKACYLSYCYCSRNLIDFAMTKLFCVQGPPSTIWILWKSKRLHLIGCQGNYAAKFAENFQDQPLIWIVKTKKKLLVPAFTRLTFFFLYPPPPTHTKCVCVGGGGYYVIPSEPFECLFVRPSV